VRLISRENWDRCLRIQKLSVYCAAYTDIRIGEAIIDHLERLEDDVAKVTETVDERWLRYCGQRVREAESRRDRGAA